MPQLACLLDNTVVNARTDQEGITPTEEERQLNTNYCSLLRLRTIYTKLVRELFVVN